MNKRVNRGNIEFHYMLSYAMPTENMHASQNGVRTVHEFQPTKADDLYNDFAVMADRLVDIEQDALYICTDNAWYDYSSIDLELWGVDTSNPYEDGNTCHVKLSLQYGDKVEATITSRVETSSSVYERINEELPVCWTMDDALWGRIRECVYMAFGINV